jgi:hypothetical protein
MLRIAGGAQHWGTGSRELTAEDCRILEQEIAKGTCVLKFAADQEWLRGEFVTAFWAGNEFTLYPLTDETDEEYKERAGY